MKQRLRHRLRWFLTALLLFIVGADRHVGRAQQPGDPAPPPGAPGAALLTGWLSVVWVDGPAQKHGAPSPLFFLTDDRGRRTQIDFDEPAVQLLGGPLALNGRRLHLSGDYLDTGRWRFRARAIGRDWQGEARATQARRGQGVHALASAISKPYVTILVRFSNRPATPNPKSYYETLMSNSPGGMDHYWREQSYNRINLIGSRVVGWYNLPQPIAYYQDPTAVCGFDWDKIVQDATAVADADVYFPDYYGINIMLNDSPGSAACGGSDYLTLDGVSRLWGVTINPNWGHNLAMLGHEMGHSLGMDHSSGPYDQTYDSQWDIMSAAFNEPGVNAYHKYAVGWIPRERIYQAMPGTTQTILLERLAQPATTDYLLAQIPIGGWASRYYTVEARRFTGYDQGLPGQAVILHRVDTTRGDRRSQVVDTDNNGNSNDAGARWIPGETFVDTENGVSVRVDAPTDTGFRITITNNSPISGRVVTNTTDLGPGSLRNAVDWVNFYHADSSVRFNIPTSDPNYSGGVFTIRPTAPLAPLSENGKTIDGTTQTAFTGNTNPAGPEVAIDGSQAPAWSEGLHLRAAHCTVKGLAVHGFDPYGIVVFGEAASGNVLAGNYIGTDATGAAARPNGYAGVLIAGGAHHNTIGGTTAAARNTISGNATLGLLIADPGSDHNLVQGNYIGTDVTGKKALGNGWAGVGIWNGARNNTIGGASSGAGNRIAFNAHEGIVLFDAETVGNTLRGNALYANGALGINLVGGTENGFGVTANDGDDSDTGPNNLQNYPAFTSVTDSGGKTRIAGTLSGLPSTTYVLDFYGSSDKDASNHGEGEVHVGSLNVTTNSSSNAAFAFTGGFPGLYVSAIATHAATGDTSEFSQAAANPSPLFAALSLNPASVKGGTPSTGTITLSSPAPAGGATISLSSSSTAVATVPKTVKVAAGKTTATFTVKTKAVTSSKSVTIKGTHYGVVRSAALTVTP